MLLSASTWLIERRAKTPVYKLSYMPMKQGTGSSNTSHLTAYIEVGNVLVPDVVNYVGVAHLRLADGVTLRDVKSCVLVDLVGGVGKTPLSRASAMALSSFERDSDKVDREWTHRFSTLVLRGETLPLPAKFPD
eukprot:4234091-Amphidinium_carterae.1